MKDSFFEELDALEVTRDVRQHITAVVQSAPEKKTRR